MESPETGQGETGPVTTIIARMVKSDRLQDFEVWLTGINQVVRKFDGYLGMDVIRPSGPNQLEYVIILRFDDYLNLKERQESSDRVEWVEKSDEMTFGDMVLQEAHGVESWFTLPGRPAVLPPAKYKMAIITIAVIYPTIRLIGSLLNLLPEGLPQPLYLPITVVLAGTSMTYLLMPWATRLLKPWLFRSGKA
jgi:antibiotic biosynthesis monooxygenase (ABM) superfamily enzyme